MPDAVIPGGPSAAWNEETPPEWVNSVDAVPWFRDGNAYYKRLACPRCTHAMSVETGGGATTLAPDLTIVARCNCQTEANVHAGRPAAITSGCGRAGDIATPAANLPDTGPPAIAGSELVDALRWEKEAADARHTSLTSVRATADSWGKTITAVMGAFTVVAFLKGPESVGDLPAGIAVAVVILILFAAALVGYAVVLAAMAAQGEPTWSRVLTGSVLRQNAESDTRTAIDRLNRSRQVTLVAFGVFLLALTVAWIGTATSSEPTAQRAIVSTATMTACGEITTVGDGSLQLLIASAPPVAIAPEAALTLVDSCP